MNRILDFLCRHNWFHSYRNAMQNHTGRKVLVCRNCGKISKPLT